ncbi:MAG: bifunctional riboflavin kinase/FAD synthetase [Deltaproteobacteria bacterium]|nr:bifunctional riboflavin kinase/FAD synthetase [Deltaproteobacteria bacterium]
MQVILNLNEIAKPLTNPVLTIGNFDGVHKGHLALFDKVKERAKAIAGQSVVMTFEPHPLKIMRPANGPQLITHTGQKLELIEKAGIDVIVCVSFDREFAAIPARDFVNSILVKKIGIKEIVVGYDYTFGHNREGDINLLREIGNDFGFVVHLVGPIEIDHTLVSSTSIRRLVQEGRLEEARVLLGRDFEVQGTVVKGRNRGGRLLGFPTANLNPHGELLPKTGVYAVKLLIDDAFYDGVTNVGYNPTFGDTGLTVETHVLDYSGELMGKTIKVHFIKRLRDEKTFKTLEELSGQIAQDIARAEKVLREA